MVNPWGTSTSISILLKFLTQRLYWKGFDLPIHSLYTLLFFYLWKPETTHSKHWKKNKLHTFEQHGLRPNNPPGLNPYAAGFSDQNDHTSCLGQEPTYNVYYFQSAPMERGGGSSIPLHLAADTRTNTQEFTKKKVQKHYLLLLAQVPHLPCTCFYTHLSCSSVMLRAFPMGSNPTAWKQLHHNPSKSLRKAHKYTYTFPLESNQKISFAHRVQHRLWFKTCCTMLSLRTSQVKNMNTYINYQDLTDFIETSFHKREGISSLSRDCKNIAKVTRITCQMVLYFLSFFLLFFLCPSCCSFDRIC